MLLALMLLLQDSETPRGHLLVVGGGRVPPAARDEALRLAGGRPARVLVVPHASARPEAGREAAALWPADHVSILDLSDPRVESADLIWIGGGDQNRLMKALRGTGIPEAIRKRHREGAVVGGTSAGAAALSLVMLTGGEPATAEGLGLWPEAIIDQHFLRRGRLPRLLDALRDHPKLLGVGIDECAAVLVSRGRLRVYGESAVVLVRGRELVVLKPPDEVPR